MITLAGHDDYSPAIIAELICERLMEGASLRQIYKTETCRRAIAIQASLGIREREHGRVSHM
jgi:hypothetical protein